MQPFRSSTFFYTFGPHAPTKTLVSGETLRVECPDSDGRFADDAQLSESQTAVHVGSTPFAGNPMAGPIRIDSAAPDDVLAVEIKAIHLTASHGQTLIKPGHGLLREHDLVSSAQDRVPTHMYRWTIDAATGAARLNNPLGNDPIAIKLDPFIGCIGVCPKWSQSISTLFAGEFGGNMDVPLTKPGATLFLPVFTDGALLGLGDVHAAQGHGEIIGGAIETAGQVDLSVRVIKQRRITVPLLRNKNLIAAIASENDLQSSIRSANANLVQWLAVGFKLNRFDAYNLVSQCGSVVLGNITSPTPSVAACIELDRLPASAIERETELL